MSHTWTVDSLDRVDDAEWGRAAGDGLAMDLRLLRCFAETMGEQCRCWGVLIREKGSGRVIAAAAVGVFTVDALNTMGEGARRLAGGVRRIRPRFLTSRVLFCGLPIPAGHNHLRIVPGVARGPVLAALDRALRGLARREKAKMVVLKEFGAEAAGEVGEDLTSLGYLRRPLPPAFRLAGMGRFGDMAGYVGAMRAGYRREVNKSVRKFEAAGLRVVRAAGAEMAALYTDRVHELYLAVNEKAKYKLERLPAAFFRGLAATFGDLAQLTLVLAGAEHETPVGFTVALSGVGVRYELYAGVDYDHEPDNEVYFNLFFLALDRALRAGEGEVHLGQTAEEFKSRLGAEPETLELFVRAVNPVSHIALRLLARWAFPPVVVPPARRVFKSCGAE